MIIIRSELQGRSVFTRSNKHELYRLDMLAQDKGLGYKGLLSFLGDLFKRRFRDISELGSSECDTAIDRLSKMERKEIMKIRERVKL